MIRWHYPRQELANQFLDSFDIGNDSTMTLFAPRRMGKTEFLLNDLIPHAEISGFRTVYVNFWQFENDPVQCLITGLRNAQSPEVGQSSVKRFVRHLPRDLSIAVDGVGNIGDTSTPMSNNALRVLQREFERFLSTRKKVLLCLDEVQHFAAQETFEPLVYFLRTTIDTNRDRLKVLFTGSSRDGLHTPFSRRTRPLFHSSIPIDLPLLGTAFVDHISFAFTKASGLTLNQEEALRAFQILNRVPYDFRVVVDTLIREGRDDILTLAKEYHEASVARADYDFVWKSVRSMDPVLC